MKKLGIIGGMGPLADEAFISLLHSYAKCKRDCDYIPFLLDGNCLRPDRSDFICGKSHFSPLNSLLYSARLLVQADCDCIAMPCNTAHFWYSDIRKIIPPSIDFPSIVSLTVSACTKKSKTVLLLSTDGTRQSGIYERKCKASGLELISIPEKIKALTKEIIFSVKSGKSPDISELLQECSAYTNSVILGCTELSHAIIKSSGKYCERLSITDSLSVLAKYVLERFYKRAFSIPYT